MNLKKKRIFVSGAAGVIGIQLIKLLEKEGSIIFAADKKNRPKEFSKKVFYRQGDLNYIKKHEVESYNCNIFFHLAATFERTNENFSFYSENFKHNINLSNKLLKLFGKNKEIEKIIFASSYLIYDKSNYLKKILSKPISLEENSSCDTRNLVGTAKYLHEKELEFFDKFSKKTKFYNIRIFRGYGLGSRDIISRWVRLALNKKKIKLYNPESSFDFIFCVDSASGLLKIAKSQIKEKVINLGSGKPEQIKNVIYNLKLFFKNLKIKNLESDKLLEKSYSGNKIIKKLNWKANYNLKKGIKEIINYESNVLKINFKKEKKIDQKNKILITCFGPKKIPWLKHINFASDRVDSKLEVLIGNSKINKIVKTVCKKIYLMPDIEKYNYREMLKSLKKNNIKIVIPTNGQELLFWSKYKDKFSKNNINIIISPYQSIKICTDKYEFFKFCKIKKIPTINTVQDIKYLQKLNSSKYVIKDRFGSGSNKIFLDLNLNKLKAKVKNFGSHIIQDYIRSNKEYSVDAWYSGDMKLSKYFIRKRDYVEDGESKITSTVKSYKFKKLLEKYLNTFKLYGPVNFQFFEYKNKIFLIECNPRFGGATTFSLSCGLDLFYYSILNAYHNNTMYDRILDKKILPIERQIRITSDTDEDYNF